MMCEQAVTGSDGLNTTSQGIIERVKCPLCSEPFRDPKVLACFHSFCKPCLEKQIIESDAEKITCPQCHVETQLSAQLGIDSLLSDYGLESVLARQLSDESAGLEFGSPTTPDSPGLDSPIDQNSNSASATCTGCKSGEAASAFCQDCTHYLCGNCTMAHQYMHCFEGHRVEQFGQDVTDSPRSEGNEPAYESDHGDCKCIQHRTQPLRYFCLTCNVAICQECVETEHLPPQHCYDLIDNVAEKQIGIMESLLDEANNKQNELQEMFKMLDAAQGRLSASFNHAQKNVEDAAKTLVNLVEESRRKLVKELENAQGVKQLQLNLIDKKIQQMTEKLGQTIEFTQRLVKYASPTGVMVFQQLLHTRLQVFLSCNPDPNNLLHSNCEVEFTPLDVKAVRQQIVTLMGPVRGGSDWAPGTASSVAGMPPTPIGRVPSRQLLRASTNPVISSSAAYSDSNLLRPPKCEFVASAQSLSTFPNIDTAFVDQYQKWSMGLDPASGIQLTESPVTDNVEKNLNLNSALCPPRSQIKRQKMIYHCKFGEFGIMEGQFTEPSGVAVNAKNDIVVADTNNHRIQVFDKEGRFKVQFGECGKRDGQLLYPNRVAVNRVTGDFVVTERSPTHQIQIYNQYGQFLRKFGANVLQHPRGVCVDNKGRIIVVECKVMRVLIFDMYGNVLQKFSCSRHLEFPNGVCSNDKQEILISDNRAHCIKVFNYEGQYVRQIGAEGITNYPIGVGINAAGEVVVADNHNNFNLTVFSQDGTMISALESKVKHAQCFDMALVEDGSVVLASKDYRLYLYRYQNSVNNN